MIEVVATIPVDVWPRDVAVAGDGARVYVANQTGNSVSVIDTATATVVDTVVLAEKATFPMDLVVHPDGTRVYVGLYGGVFVIDTVTAAVVSGIETGNAWNLLTIHPDGSTLYAAGGYPDGTVTVIDTATEAVAETIGVGLSPYRPRISGEGSRVYVPIASTTTVAVVDTATAGVTYIEIGGEPYNVAVSSDGTALYATEFAREPMPANTVKVIDPASGAATATVAVPNESQPAGLVVHPDGSRVYAAYEDGVVAAIDTGAGVVTETVEASYSAGSLAISPDGSRLYVPNAEQDSVSVIATG